MEVSNLYSEVSKLYRDQDEMVVKMSPDQSGLHAWDQEYKKSVNQQRKRAAIGGVTAGGLALGGAQLTRSARPMVRRAGIGGIAAGVGALGYAAHQTYSRPKVNLSKRVWSEKELQHRKRVQGGLAIGGSTAGLTSLGLLAASAAARKRPQLIRISPEKLKDASFTAGVTGGGIGGVGGYHFAALQNQESKRRKLDQTKQREILGKAVNYDERRKTGNATAGIGAAGIAGGAGMAVGGQRMTRRALDDAVSRHKGKTIEAKRVWRPRGKSFYRVAGTLNPTKTIGRASTLTGAGIGLGMLGAGTALGGLVGADAARTGKKRQLAREARGVSKKLTPQQQHRRDAAAYGAAGLIGAGALAAGTKRYARALPVTNAAIKHRVHEYDLVAPPKQITNLKRLAAEQAKDTLAVNVGAAGGALALGGSTAAAGSLVNSRGYEKKRRR